MNSNGDKSSGLKHLKPTDFIWGKPVYGRIIDHQTRCTHYHSSEDIIAIKFKCCGHYYPCYECHQEAAGHTAQQWEENEWNSKAVLCGSCGFELTINEYFSSVNKCPQCKELFNPNCEKHYSLYFRK
ncbi:CHY zinc finger protein [soil metagenome]